MSYVECPKCGQHALSVATQCPKCGQEFLSAPARRLVEEPQAPRLRPLLLMVGGLLVAVILVVTAAAIVWRLLTPREAGMAPLVAPVDTMRAAPDRPDSTPRDTAPTRRDTAPTRRDTSPSVTRADTPRPVARAPAPTPPPAAEPTAAATPPVSESVRYARDWVNVRSRRDPKARILRVLKPGQAVEADSLKQQWYRVLIDGKPVGYVYRGYLSATAP